MSVSACNFPSNLKVLPGTAIAATALRTYYSRVYYQEPQGGVVESLLDRGAWSGGPSTPPLFKAALFTPLSAISWKDGKEIRVYYLDDKFVIQEHCFSEGKGWYRGAFGDLGIKVDRICSLAALEFGDAEGGVHIRVYYQDTASNAIKEVCNDGKWVAGHTFAAALSGTSLASTTHRFPGDTLQLRVYYQATDYTIQEHCFQHGKGWFEGDFNSGKTTARTAISALGFNVQGGVVLQVYWVDSERLEIVQKENKGSWSGVNKIVGQYITPDAQLSITQWNAGEFLRLYFQTPDDSVQEFCNDSNGSGWFVGTRVAQAQS